MLFSLIFSIVRFGYRSQSLIIHFDIYKGIDFVSSKEAVFAFLIMVLIMMLINLVLSEFVYNRERFLSYLFAYLTLIISIFSFIVIIVVNSVN